MECVACGNEALEDRMNTLGELMHKLDQIERHVRGAQDVACAMGGAAQVERKLAKEEA